MVPCKCAKIPFSHVPASDSLPSQQRDSFGLNQMFNITVKVNLCSWGKMEELVSLVLFRPFPVLLWDHRKHRFKSENTEYCENCSVYLPKKSYSCILHFLQNSMEGRNFIPILKVWGLVFCFFLRIGVLPGVIATNLQDLASRTEQVLQASLLSHRCPPLPNPSLPLPQSFNEDTKLLLVW